MSAAIRQGRPAVSGNVIPAQHVHMADEPPTAGAGTATEPRITLIKDGERIRGIEVVCTCGEVIRLDCMY